MQPSFTTSVSIAMFAFMVNANAQVIPTLSPELPKTFNECLSMGASESACQALLTAPDNCEKIHSSDEEAWRGCLALAEATFHKSVATGGVDTGSYVGESLPVSTNASDSHYEQKGPDHKGYLNAEE